MTAPAWRWDKSDEAGARNLVDNAATMRGVACVRTGEVIPLSILIEGGTRGPASPGRMPVQHFMVRDGCDYAGGLEERHGFGFTDDVIMLPTHGTTHIDALSHVLHDGCIYNGFPASTVTSRGASRCGIDKLSPIVTRGLFVDLAPPDEAEPGFAITADQLAAGIARAGIHPEPGDALLVRTGWLAAWRAGRASALQSSGLHHDCADWIVDCGFALVAADNVAVEVLPSRDPDCAVPLHLRLLLENGIYLAELLDLEALAAAGRASFQLIVAPLRIKGGVGSPITPVAVL